MLIDLIPEPIRQRILDGDPLTDNEYLDAERPACAECGHHVSYRPQVDGDVPAGEPRVRVVRVSCRCRDEDVPA